MVWPSSVIFEQSVYFERIKAASALTLVLEFQKLNGVGKSNVKIQFPFR